MHDLHGHGIIDRVIALRSFPVYATLPFKDVEALARQASERTYRSGEYLLRAGDPAQHVFFVLSGRIEVRLAGNTVDVFGPGSVVGGLATLTREADRYECIAKEEASVLALKASALLDSFDDHFEMVRAVLGGMSEEMLKRRRAMGPSGGFAPTEWTPEGEPPAPMNLIERLGLLRGAMPFAGTRLEALADLARECTELREEQGHVLWNEGDLAESFVFIVWGSVSTTNDDGLDARFGPGDVIGFLGPFSGQGRWYTARAETEIVGLQLSTEVLLDVCEDHTELGLEMVRMMAGGLLHVMSKPATVPPPASDD